jgi:hypothetical protein
MQHNTWGKDRNDLASLASKVITESYSSDEEDFPDIKSGERASVTFTDGSNIEGEIKFDGPTLATSNTFTINGGESHGVEDVVSVDIMHAGGQEVDFDALFYKKHDRMPESQEESDSHREAYYGRRGN